MKKTTFILFIILFFSQSSKGQYSFSDVVVSNTTIPPILALSVIPNTSYNITFADIDQMLNGVTIAEMNTFQVKSNVQWRLTVNSSTAFFTANGVYSSSNMPASLLKIGLTGNNTPMSLSTLPQTLKTGNRGNYTAAGNTFSMYLEANPAFNYGPGQYTITINYTLSAL